MATKTSIWFDGDEYRWDDEKNDYVYRTVVEGRIVKRLYEEERARRGDEDVRAFIEETESEDAEQYKKSALSQVLKGLTLLYAKTGDERYDDAARNIRESLSSDVDVVRYAAQGSQGVQGVQGIKGVQGHKGFGGKKPSIWFNGYNYEYDAETGDYVRWVKMGNGPARPFTLKEAKTKALEETKKDPKKARALKKKAKEIIRSAQRSVKGKNKSWSETQTTKRSMSGLDFYTCLTHGNHLKKTWASYTIAVALMKKRGYSQKKIDEFTNAALDKTMDVFRRAYKHNGGAEAAVALTQGFSSEQARRLYEKLRVLKKDAHEKYSEKLVRRAFEDAAKVVAGKTSSEQCRQIAKKLFSSYNSGLKRGYANLSADRESRLKAYSDWKNKNQKKETNNVSQEQAKGRPTAADGRPDRSREGTGAGTGGGSGSGTPKAGERGNVGGGRSGSEPAAQRGGVAIEPETKEDLEKRIKRLSLERSALYKAEPILKKTVEIGETATNFYKNRLESLRGKLKRRPEHNDYLRILDAAYNLSTRRVFDVIPSLKNKANLEKRHEVVDKLEKEAKKETDVYARLGELIQIGTPRSDTKSIIPPNPRVANIAGLENASKNRQAAKSYWEYENTAPEDKWGWKGREFTDDEKTEIVRLAREVALRCYKEMQEVVPSAETAKAKLKENAKRKEEIEEESATIEERLKKLVSEKKNELAPRKLANFVAGAMERKREETDAAKREAGKDAVLRNYRELKNRRDNPVPEPPKAIETPVAVKESSEPGIVPGRPKTEKIDYDNGVYSVPLGELKLDPKRFQFKLEVDAETGAGDLYKGAKFDPKLSNTIMVWRDPQDGNDYVVNGHHRMSIAKNSGYTGALQVRYCEAKTAEEAKVEGAIANIVDDKGSAVDVADVLRHDPNFDKNSKVKDQIPENNKLARNGRALAKLSDKLYTRVKKGELDWEKAVPIGEVLGIGTIDDAEGAQWAVYNMCLADGKNSSPDAIRRIAQTVARRKPPKKKGDAAMSLFSFDNAEDKKDWELSIMCDAELRAAIEEYLSSDKSLHKAMGSDANIEHLSGSNTIKDREGVDVETSQKRSEAAKQARDALTGKLSKDDTLIGGVVGKLFDEQSEAYYNLAKDGAKSKKLSAERKRIAESVAKSLIRVCEKWDSIKQKNLSPTEKTELALKIAKGTGETAEPPKKEEPTSAEPPKAEQPKEEPKPKESKHPKKETFDASVGKDLDAAERSILRFVKKVVGDGKVNDSDDFLKDAARELSAVHKQTVAPSYCGSVLYGLEKNGFVARNDDKSLSLSAKGRAALRNLDSKKK